MNLEQRLKEVLSKGLRTIFSLQLAPEDITLQPTRKEFEGSYTLVTFPFTKELKLSPEQIAQQLGDFALQNSTAVSGFNVAKGFLNLVIAEQAWLEVFNTFALEHQYGFSSTLRGKVMVEYSSPNTNKPLHLGHLRNNFLGLSVSRILKANGQEVRKVNLVNDRGIHICKSMVAYLQAGATETPLNTGIKGDKLVGNYYVAFDKQYKTEIQQLVAQGMPEEEAKKQAPVMVQAQELLRSWEEGDPDTIALWKKMNGWVYEGFDKTYASIGVDFDQFYYESDTYLLGKKIVEEGLQKGVFFKKEDGSVWVDLTADGLDEKLLLRSDGTSVYITQDLGTADLKYSDFKFDTSVYVVGNEQDYHFKVLQLILKKLNKPYADAIYHLSYGMVDLPSGKMKSREGTVVDADELVAEMVDTARAKTDELGKIDGFTEAEAQQLYHTLAMGALKYYLLKVDPKKRMLFNPEESIDFKGHTGPFVQYTYARISAVLRKAAQQELQPAKEAYANVTELHTTELELIAALNQFTAIVAEAATQFAPSLIAQYVYDLAKTYNRLYQEVSILQESDAGQKALRIALSQTTAYTIKNAMYLLGIDVPERM